MLYIPRNRKLEIAPRFSRAHQTRTGRNIHEKQGRVLSPFLVARCFSPQKCARMCRATQRQRGQLDGSVTSQQPPSFTFTSSSWLYSTGKKSQEAMGTRRQGDSVNIARALRSRSPRTFSTLLWDRAQAKTQDKTSRFPWRKTMSYIGWRSSSIVLAIFIQLR